MHISGGRHTSVMSRIKDLQGSNKLIKNRGLTHVAQKRPSYRETRTQLDGPSWPHTGLWCKAILSSTPRERLPCWQQDSFFANASNLSHGETMYPKANAARHLSEPGASMSHCRTAGIVLVVQPHSDDNRA